MLNYILCTNVFTTTINEQTGVYTGTSKKNEIIEYHEKGQHFLSLISESEIHLLYRFITHRVKYFKPLFLEILMIMATDK